MPTTLRRTFAVLAAPAAAIALAAPASATIAQPQPAANPATQGIIMRDGGICDPIRHMGC